MSLQAPLPELFEKSKVMVLDFAHIAPGTPPEQDISAFFAESEAAGRNPRLPENRQAFNNNMLAATGMRYLVSQYGEDRIAMLRGSHIATEGRTLHMGIDIFSRDLEPVYAPCDGEIVRADREPGDHGYGNYIIMKPDETGPGMPAYIFFGHLGAAGLAEPGHVAAGEVIAELGDYVDGENGGWSRHLHLQMLADLPPEGETPIGYSTKEAFPQNSQRFPDPMQYLPGWHIAQ